MQSLVTFDFRELFGRGFAFDLVSCGADIANGTMTTQNFHMKGPSARVSMSGQVDLVRRHRTFTRASNLRWAPFLAPPYHRESGVGPGALILDQILKNPSARRLRLITTSREPGRIEGRAPQG
jgi:hypothetical protein